MLINICLEYKGVLMRKILFVLSCCIIGFSLWGCGASQVSAASDETTPTILETVVETEPVVEETFVEDVTVATEETLPPEPLYKEYEYFTSDVSYEFEYIENGEVIPHVFFEPSTAEDFEKIPLMPKRTHQDFPKGSRAEYRIPTKAGNFHIPSISQAARAPQP